MKTTVQNKTVILTLAQYNARKQAGNLEQGVTYKIKGAPLEGIKINNTIIARDSDGYVTIPIATSSSLGMVYGYDGITISSSGEIMTDKANNDNLENKDNNYRPVVSTNLDKAVMEGLGNNGLTWSDAYKASARTTINAQAQVVYTILEEDE